MYFFSQQIKILTWCGKPKKFLFLFLPVKHVVGGVIGNQLVVPPAADKDNQEEYPMQVAPPLDQPQDQAACQDQEAAGQDLETPYKVPSPGIFRDDGAGDYPMASPPHHHHLPVQQIPSQEPQ